MNSVNLIGNLGKDNDLKFGQSGTAVLNQSLAVRQAFKNKQTGEYESDWVNLVLFGKTAENFANFTRKGSKVGIEGRIQSGSYENQQGQKIYTTDVIVNQFHLIEPKNNDSSGYQSNQYNYQKSNQQPHYQNNAQNNGNSGFNNQPSVDNQYQQQNANNNQFGGNMPIQGGTDIDVTPEDLPF